MLVKWRYTWLSNGKTHFIGKLPDGIRFPLLRLSIYSAIFSCIYFITVSFQPCVCIHIWWLHGYLLPTFSSIAVWWVFRHCFILFHSSYSFKLKWYFDQRNGCHHMQQYEILLSTIIWISFRYFILSSHLDSIVVALCWFRFTMYSHVFSLSQLRIFNKMLIKKMVGL